MILKAPAKINLTLDVTGKREDGYHTIESIMQTITLFDEVTLEKTAEGIELMCNKSYLPLNEKNTAYKSAALFFEETGTKGGISININKKIPGRAGMGGGSADAAAVLIGMNKLYGTGLSREKLMEMGAKIGADVPFCIIGGTCRCEGIGEICTRVSPMPNCFIVICKPAVGMSTPKAYAQIDKHELKSSGATDKMAAALKEKNLENIAAVVSNQFDSAMRLKLVQIIKKKLVNKGALTAMMTGSGSAVYGIFEDEAVAKKAMYSLKRFGETFFTRPLNR